MSIKAPRRRVKRSCSNDKWHNKCFMTTLRWNAAFLADHLLTHIQLIHSPILTELMMQCWLSTECLREPQCSLVFTLAHPAYVCSKLLIDGKVHMAMNSVWELRNTFIYSASPSPQNTAFMNGAFPGRGSGSTLTTRCANHTTQPIPLPRG